jgi:hypothetical protein
MPPHASEERRQEEKRRTKRTKNVLDELSAVSARELGVELGGHHVAPLKRGDELDLFSINKLIKIRGIKPGTRTRGK